MKTRHGFVSNSSSSSFIILRDSLTEEEFFAIMNYEEEIGNLGWDIRTAKCMREKTEDEWTPIWAEGEIISGFTTMCNGEMPAYFKKLDVLKYAIFYDQYGEPYIVCGKFTDDYTEKELDMMIESGIMNYWEREHNDDGI